MAATQRFYVIEADALTALSVAEGYNAHDAQNLINELVDENDYAPGDLVVIRGNVVPLVVTTTATLGRLP